MTQIDKLKKQLVEAIEDMNFKLADAISDRLDKLENNN